MKIRINDTDRNKDRALIALAIVGLVLIECIALIHGFNGMLLRWVTIMIAGLAGLIVPTPKITQKLKELMRNG